MIGDYAHPKTRMPGAGGAPEIACHARQTFVVLKQSPRSFVERLDFRSSAGFLGGGDERAALGVGGSGPQVVITDLGVLKPDAQTRELTLVARYENVTVEQIVAATGWQLRVAESIEVVPPPTAEELAVLRDLNERTRVAHAKTRAAASALQFELQVKL